MSHSDSRNNNTGHHHYIFSGPSSLVRRPAGLSQWPQPLRRESVHSISQSSRSQHGRLHARRSLILQRGESGCPGVPADSRTALTAVHFRRLLTHSELPRSSLQSDHLASEEFLLFDDAFDALKLKCRQQFFARSVRDNHWQITKRNAWNPDARLVTIR